MIEGRRFSNPNDPSISGETEFRRCNFSQTEPVASGDTFIGVRLFSGDSTPRSFEKCNLVNCDVPPGSSLIGCNTTITRYKVQTATDEIIIDGFDLTVGVLNDYIYGRLVSPGVYDYHPIPIELPNTEPLEDE